MSSESRELTPADALPQCPKCKGLIAPEAFGDWEFFCQDCGEHFEPMTLADCAQFFVAAALPATGEGCPTCGSEQPEIRRCLTPEVHGNRSYNNVHWAKYKKCKPCSDSWHGALSDPPKEGKL